LIIDPALPVPKPGFFAEVCYMISRIPFLFPGYYNITNAQGKVARLCLFKQAYKIGEDIVGLFDFTDAEIPCVQVNCFDFSKIMSVMITFCKTVPDVFIHESHDWLSEYKLRMNRDPPTNRICFALAQPMPSLNLYLILMVIHKRSTHRLLSFCVHTVFPVQEERELHVLWFCLR
jgi:hypothetical protein